MKEKKKRNPVTFVTFSKKPSKKHTKKDPDKRYPDPDDPHEKTGMPIKEMPLKNNPHREEILDRTPE